MIPQKYMPPIKYLGGSIVILLLLGLVVYPLIDNAFFTDEIRSEVLISSIPFVAIFVSIILAYVLFMFIFAYRFNRKIPYRTHRAIELTIIAGIVIGVIALFQPVQLVGYQYGFIWLLGATLTFILWSHVTPQPLSEAENLPPFSTRDQVGGFVVAAVVMIIILTIFIGQARPVEPYGYTQRQWERGLNDEQKQAIIVEAESTFRTFTVPYFIVMGLLPSVLVFFAAREVIASRSSSKRKVEEHSVGSVSTSTT